MGLSNLPPGCTNRDVEGQAGAYGDDLPCLPCDTPATCRLYGCAGEVASLQAELAALRAWVAEGERVMAHQPGPGLLFRLGVWWGSRPR